MSARSTAGGAEVGRGARWVIGIGLAIALAVSGMAGTVGYAGAALLDEAADHAYEDETTDDHATEGGHDHAAGTTTATAAEQAAADALIAGVLAQATRYTDFAAAEADGFIRVGPLFGGVGPAHYVKPEWVNDGRYLDPTQPEALIYLTTWGGERHLLGVMFLAPIGAGPTPAGALTHWHTHEGTCTGPNASGATIDGACPAGTIPIPYEMLHVWTFDHPEGPLAGRMDGVALSAAARELVA